MNDQTTSASTPGAGNCGIQFARRAHRPRRRDLERRYVAVPAERDEPRRRTRTAAERNIHGADDLIDCDLAVAVGVHQCALSNLRTAERNADTDDQQCPFGSGLTIAT